MAVRFTRTARFDSFASSAMDREIATLASVAEGLPCGEQDADDRSGLLVTLGAPIRRCP